MGLLLQTNVKVITENLHPGFLEQDIFISFLNADNINNFTEVLMGR